MATSAQARTGPRSVEPRARPAPAPPHIPLTPTQPLGRGRRALHGRVDGGHQRRDSARPRDPRTRKPQRAGGRGSTAAPGTPLPRRGRTTGRPEAVTGKSTERPTAAYGSHGSTGSPERVFRARSAWPRRMAEPLPLDAAATLNALLTGSGQVSSALRAQLPYARAVGRYGCGCGCGCATVDVAVDHTAVPPASRSRQSGRGRLVRRTGGCRSDGLHEGRIPLAPGDLLGLQRADQHMAGAPLRRALSTAANPIGVAPTEGCSCGGRPGILASGQLVPFLAAPADAAARADGCPRWRTVRPADETPWHGRSTADRPCSAAIASASRSACRSGATQSSQWPPRHGNIAAERSHQQYLDHNMNGYCGIGRTGVKPGDPFGTNWGAACSTGIASAED